MACACFFGHRDATERVLPMLEAAVTELVENRGVDTFLIGNNGRFDSIAYSALKRLKTRCPHISVTVVLAYLPQGGISPFAADTETVFPEEAAAGPRRFAILRRNRYMIGRSDMVVVYARTSCGGAAAAAAEARKQGKQVIEL